MLHKVEIIQKAWPPSVRSTGIYIDIKYLCSNLHFQSLCNRSLVYPNNFLLKQVSALFPRLREAGSGPWLAHVEALGQTQRTVSGKSFRGGGVLWNLLFLKTLKTDWFPHRNALLVKNWEGASRSLSPLKVHTPTEKLGTGGKRCLGKGKLSLKRFPRNVFPMAMPNQRWSAEPAFMTEFSSEDPFVSLTAAKEVA